MIPLLSFQLFSVVVFIDKMGFIPDSYISKGGFCQGGLVALSPNLLCGMGMKCPFWINGLSMRRPLSVFRPTRTVGYERNIMHNDCELWELARPAIPPRALKLKLIWHTEWLLCHVTSDRGSYYYIITCGPTSPISEHRYSLLVPINEALLLSSCRINCHQVLSKVGIGTSTTTTILITGLSRSLHP